MSIISYVDRVIWEWKRGDVIFVYKSLFWNIMLVFWNLEELEISSGCGWYIGLDSFYRW